MTPVPDGVRRNQAIRDEPAPPKRFPLFERNAFDSITKPTRRATPWSNMLVFFAEENPNV